jgi:SAM-dependent methyltransferase
MNDKKAEWNRSYENHNNFLFYPNEEVIRFVSKFIRKRIGLNESRDVAPERTTGRMLDLGCGIGRHIIYAHDLGIDVYGIDLSDEAIRVARMWAHMKGMATPEDRIVQGDIQKLKWADGFFLFAVSHGVLDSMPFEIARSACIELSRVMSSGGLFYCDVISGDDSYHAREFSGEEVITTEHEQGTIQLYFNLTKIQSMIAGVFEINECILVRRENVLSGGYTSRYHLILRKI